MDKFEACIRLKEALREGPARVLLNDMLDSDKTKIEPVFARRKGLRYPYVEQVTGLSPVDALGLLEELSRTGVLRKVLYDKTVFCPDCASPEISIHFNCPNCGSQDTVKLSLIEDMGCGYIDKEERFRKDGKLVCPHCGRILSRPGIDFRRVGIWYVCNSCESEFDMPIITYSCRTCGRSFSMEEALYEAIYSYEMEESVRDVAMTIRNVLNSLTGLLRSRGFSVESPGFVNGRSGEEHMFDLIAAQGADKSLVVDVFVADSSIPERVVTNMFAKLYDTAFADAFLIAIPRVREEGRRLAGLYRIRLVEGSSRDEVVRGFRDLAGFS